MTRIVLLALALAACGKVTDPGAGDAHATDAPTDAERLSKPVAEITSVGIAGAPAQCKLATPSTGSGTITYTASWTIDATPFVGAVTTTIAGDTVPGTSTHTGAKVACTLFATNGAETQISDPVSVTMKPRIAFAVDRAAGVAQLDSIDLDTLTLTAIGRLGVPANFGDLAWDSVHQKLYLTDGQSGTTLFTVDVTTGTATAVGAHGVADVFALGFDPVSKQMFAGTVGATNTLLSVDLGTGAMTPIGGTFGYDGLAFDTKRNVMVGVDANLGGAKFVTVDLTTGSTTAITSAGNLNNNGLTYDPFADALWDADDDGNLVEFDPNASYARINSTAFAGAKIDGLAIALPPPP